MGDRGDDGRTRRAGRGETLAPQTVLTGWSVPCSDDCMGASGWYQRTVWRQRGTADPSAALGMTNLKIASIGISGFRRLLRSREQSLPSRMAEGGHFPAEWRMKN